MMMMRDLFLNLSVVFDKVGSNCCKDFFSLLRQYINNKHKFCTREAIERISHVERTEQIKYDGDGLLFVES